MPLEHLDLLNFEGVSELSLEMNHYFDWCSKNKTKVVR